MSRLIPQIDVVSVAATAPLAALLGAALNVGTRTVTLRPHAIGIYMDDGVATAADDPLGLNPIIIRGGPAELATLQFYAAVATPMTVIQEGEG